MLVIKGYDNYTGDKFLFDKPIIDIKKNEIFFEGGGSIDIKTLLSANEKYTICELNKATLIAEYTENVLKKEKAKFKKIQED